MRQWCASSRSPAAARVPSPSAVVVTPADGRSQPFPGRCAYGLSSLALDVNENADRHEHAMRTHAAAAERHEEAARHWGAFGDEERADLERRAARIERELVALEREMARVARERPIGGDRGAADGSL